jgi:CRP/FNR family transcriptional regulator, cyclic AMP receptor protein
VDAAVSPERAFVRELLASTKVMAAAAPATVDGIAEASHVKRVASGQTLFIIGDRADALYVVAEGLVRLYVPDPDGNEPTVVVVAPGDVFGELGVFDGGPRSASAEAIRSGRLVVVPGAAIDAALASDPGFARSVITVLGCMIRRTTGQWTDLRRLDLSGRIAKYLLAQGERCGSDRVELALTQEQLAELVGGVRQTVNHVLRSFARDGLIELNDHDAVLLRPSELARLAGNPTSPTT